jgi:HrpA-like RNA helicase
LGINDIENFDFMNKPSEEAISASLNELELLGAIKKVTDESHTNDQNVNKKRLITIKYELTAIGKKVNIRSQRT